MAWRQATWINLLFDTSLTSVYIIGTKLILRRIPETITIVDFSTFIKQILSLKCIVYYVGITVCCSF